MSIREAYRGSTWASVATSAGATKRAVARLPPVCRVPKVQDGGERNSAWLIYFVDDVISVEIQWKEGGARCKALTAFFKDTNCQSVGEKTEGDDTLVPKENIAC